MKSTNGNIFCVTGHLCEEFTGPRWILHTKASDAEVFYFFFDLRLNKRLSKQSWGWWFETLSCPLWRHCRGPTHIQWPPAVNGPPTDQQAIIFWMSDGKSSIRTTIGRMPHLYGWHNGIIRCLGHLARMFERLQEAGLKLKPSKCPFFRKSVQFLDHMLSENDIHTDPEKIAIVTDWPVLKTPK